MSPDRRLKIAVVSTQRGWYGGEEQIHLLAQGLQRRGHDVHILARRDGKLAQRMKDEGFPVSRFAGNGRNPLALWQIRRQLRRLRPDVLQYNDSHALTAAGLASWRVDVGLRVAMRHVAWPIRSPWRFRTFCDRVVCVSYAVADICRNAGLPPEMLRVVFATTDPQKVLAGNRRQGRRAAAVNDDQTMILVVAGLNESKGHAFLLEAMPAVLRRHPNVQLILAGDGPEQESLRLQARKLQIDAHVRFLGYRRDVPDLIQAADLLALPSLAEGLSITLLDGMFAGVPLVATATGGIVDLIGRDLQEGSVAWLVPPGDGPAIAAAILEALGSPNECALRADRARRRAEQLFTADRMVDAMLEVYTETAGSENRDCGAGCQSAPRHCR